MLIKIEYNSLLSYVTYINKIPIIQTLSLTNDSDINLEGVKISIKWGNKVVENWQQDNIKLEANQTIKLNFDKQPLRVNAKEFVTTTESYPEVFTVIVEHDGSIINEQNYDITVLAYNQWLGSNYHPTLITSFITPNHPQVIRIIKNASEILKKWDTVFSGYQTQDKTDVRKQIKAIYLAIQNEQINYVSSAPSFEEFGQRVRLADDVLAGKMGNCIELAILFASCLEHARLNPIIVFLYGHAFVGCWLEDQTFQNSVDDDVASLSKRLASGVQTIELIESTLLADSSTVAYEQAVQKAYDEIVYGKKFDYLLDVSKARSLGIRPLPQKIELVSINEEQIENNHINTDNLEHLAPKSIVNTENIEVTTSSKRSKIQVWESKLLNMTLKNSLLNFKPTRRSISILEGDLNLLEDNLSSGNEFSLVPCPQEIETEKRNEKEYSFTRNLKDEYREYMNAEMKSKRIVSLLNEEDLDYAIKALYYTSRTDLEENGANTLFVAMGFLKWYESDVSKLARYAPILLYPIEMIRKSSARGYVIRFRDEEVQINTTLLEKLRVELNMEFPGLNPLPMDEKGIDVRKILNTVRTAIMDKRGWDIIDVSYIALFSFNQFVMWNDIHTRNQELMENKIVSSLLEGKPSIDFPSILETKELDKSDMFLNNAILMDADSSQLAAIYSATNGSSFVLHGPPGTGKSQTITNIIASALYNGKSVLFVAEKMAALNVVQSRLEKIGIGDFALELHSNKTKKTEVLQKIDRILSKTRNGSIKQIDEKREELQKIRDKISETTNSLHKVRDNGYSIYEMISLYESQGDNEVYPVDNLAKDVNKKLVEQAIEMLDRYVIMYGSVAPIAENPLNFIKITNLTLKDRDLFKENIEKLLKKTIVDLDSFISKQSIISIPKEASFSAIKILADMLNVSVTSNELVWSYLEKWNQEDIDPVINQIIIKGFEKQKIKQAIEKDFDLAILGFDAKTHLLAWNASLQSWFLPKFLEQNKILKAMRVYAINQKSVDKNKIKNVLESLCKYKSLDDEINQYMNIHGMKLGQLWTGEMTDWTRVKEAVEATDSIINLLRSISKLSNWFNVTSFIDNLKNEWASFKLKNKEEALQLLEHYKNVLAVKEELELFAKGELLSIFNTPADMIAKLSTVLASYSNVDKWVSYVKARTDLEAMSLTSFVNKVENGEISIESLKSITLKSLMYYGILELLEDDTILTEFNSRSFEFLLSQYKQELSIVREMTRLELIEKLVENIPKPQRDINENSELGIMMKAIKSNGRGLSLRKLFDMTPNVLRRIAPCMLMSPISIAQYIDPSFPKFDLVVFDEASQVYTHSAVGAIARGNQLIVVGDPNQLPPTAFFSGDFDDEDYDFDERDQDSILTECQSIMFPQLYLRWHYRSSHESLISFSNTQYYENKLFTFPSYNDLESKVKLVQVGGFYDRGGTKQNIAEAEAIIEEVLRRLKSPTLRKKSIGIVTFSSVQQKLIQTKLDDTMARYPQLEEYANELEEAIFVKNLENVQGDERDVILFSVGYGPDQNGKVTMNFGPLNQDGGWKRLNVVVSRSRDEMIVFSTLRPEQIDLSKTSAEGVYGLKRFLEFARNKDALIVNQQNAELVKDDMLEAIANELIKQGYSVVKNVGKSNFRIDIGVVNPKVSNEFIAAIVIDGVQYSNTPTVRDKVIVQPSMLSRLKWSVIRVWTLEWFKNKQNVLTEIKNKLDELINKNNEELQALESNEENEELEIQKLNEKNTKIEGFRESKEFKIEYIKPEVKEKIYYKAYNVEDSIYPKESFYEFASISKMAKLMNEIIQYEAPIVEEDLFRRVMSAWGISTLGTKVKEILKDAANRTKSFLILDDDKNTYWRSQEEYENGAVCRAYKDDKRKFNYIPDEEIIATIIEVLKDQISLNPSNLCKEVFKIHGYTSLGQEAQINVLSCAAYLVSKGKLVEEDERYVLS